VSVCVVEKVDITASTMPRSEDAKQWKPDAFGQDMIDRITNYVVVAERCSAHLRSFNFPDVKRLWAQVQTEFLADPVKYPSAMAGQNDMEGRQQFQLKCQAICFPQNSELSRSPEECVSRPSILAWPLSNMTPQLHSNDFCSPGRPAKPSIAGSFHASL
jgi:hypothetical protein